MFQQTVINHGLLQFVGNKRSDNILEELQIFVLEVDVKLVAAELVVDLLLLLWGIAGPV